MSGKKKGGGGGHGGAWVITFADLMALLMAFFVMLVATATQDKQKLADAAGSIQNAFGIQPVQRKAGVLERDGLPVRQFMKETGPMERPMDASHSAEDNDRRAKQGPAANTHDYERADVERPRRYLSAAASLRQALADMPEIAELSKHVVFEETSEGLDIRLVDQDGRAMFAEGSRTPYEHTRRILARLGPVIGRMPHRVRITGHTAAGRSGPTVGAGSAWSLSSGRAVAVQELLASYGVGHDRFDSVVGKADSEPLFPTDPSMAANRRIDILLVDEPPPMPSNPRG